MAGPNEQLVKFSENEARRLIQFYTAAEQEIMQELVRGLLKGNNLRYLRTMYQNVQAILNDLLNGSRQWSEQAIPEVYKKSLDFIDEQVAKSGVSSELAAGFGMVHQQAVAVLAEAAYERFKEVGNTIGRRVNDIYRRLALENIRGGAVGYKSWKQIADNYRKDLAEHGVTGFKDKKGGRWNMTTYTEMAARTTLMEVHLEGTSNRLLERGHDLVKVSRHSNPCGFCRVWEGRVISLIGKTAGYPTLVEAKAAKLFHPRCRHAYSLYLPEVDDEPIVPSLKQQGFGIITKENSIIPEAKLVNYALNKEHKGGGKDKAIAFERALGYTKDNYQHLMENLLTNLEKYPAKYRGKDQWGESYEISMFLTGPNGKTAKVKTGWKINEEKARLVTIHVDN